MAIESRLCWVMICDDCRCHYGDDDGGANGHHLDTYGAASGELVDETEAVERAEDHWWSAPTGRIYCGDCWAAIKAHEAEGWVSVY